MMTISETYLLQIDSPHQHSLFYPFPSSPYPDASGSTTPLNLSVSTPDQPSSSSFYAGHKPGDIVEGGEIIALDDHSLTLKYADGHTLTLTFDSKGRLLLSEYRDAQGNLLSSETYTYDASGALCRKETRDKHGQIIKVKTYEHDAKGELICVVTRDKNGRVIEKAHYTYADALPCDRTFSGKDKLLRLGRMELRGADGEISQSKQYLYDKNGVLIGVETHGRNGKLERSILHAHDADGRLVQTQVKGAGSDRLLVHYNQYGAPSSAETYGENGKLLGIKSFVYNEEGRPIRIEIKNAEGEILQTVIYDHTEQNPAQAILRNGVLPQDISHMVGLAWPLMPNWPERSRRCPLPCASETGMQRCMKGHVCRW